MNKNTIKDDEIKSVFEPLRASYRDKSPEEREKAILGLVGGYLKGEFPLDVITIIACAIDPANFKRILAARLPEFESFIAYIKTEFGNSHA